VAVVQQACLDTGCPIAIGYGTDYPQSKEVRDIGDDKAGLVMALHPKTGKPWGLCITQCDRERTWTEAEQILFSDIGQRITDSLTGLLVQRDLRESEARYQRMFDTANEGIWIQDENFVTTFANEHMAEMLGYTPAELVGHKVTDFMFDDDSQGHVIKMEERSRNISDVYERRLRHKDGSTVWMLISTTPIFEGGRFRGSFAMLTDISQRKQAE
jgi:PAS domain S-box-containing protein